ncbi:MAG: alpha/beta fold hydrolase [Melioribacteraceae bacterium]|nr:alpha/beta fold hydrolase [Melioribacteraceae bacterium]
MNFKKYFLSTLLLLTLLSACSEKQFEQLHVDSNNYKITTEKSLTDNLTIEKIDSFYNTGVEGTFVGKKNIEIYYKYFLQNSNTEEKGAILISDGRTEAVVKYKEAIFDLFMNGYSVYIHDHRGQGFSGRMISDSDMGFVDEFQNYIDDMKQFYNSILVPNNHKNKYLLAHSMGGAIGVIYLEQHPNDFKAAAFSSPMLGFSFPTCVVVGMLSGEEPEYARGNTNYENGIEPFLENTLTNSEIRYNRMLEVFEKYPKAKLGGASYQWVSKSCNVFDDIFDNCEKIRIPLILFSGGEEEIVDPSAHNKFIEKLIDNGHNAKGYFVAGAKHELFIEKDAIRKPVLVKIFNFYSSVN